MNEQTGCASAAALSLRQLKLFAVIGDLKSVRRASEECSLSQPAVTQALAKLEDEVGAVLIDRRASGSYPNEMGSLFHARVTRFFTQFENAIADLGTAMTPTGVRQIVNRLTRSQIRALVAITETGSFESAAESLGISSPSLQRAARDMESNLRMSLFHRTAGGMIVSHPGARLGRSIKLALQEIELGIDELRAAQGTISRPLVIGAMPFGGSVLLAATLDEFLRLHPRADIRIVSDSAPEMAASLRAGDVDMVIGLLPEMEDGELVTEALADTPYAIVVRRGHPLTGRDAVTIDDLAACDWVVGTEGSSRRRCFERIFADRPQPSAQIATCAAPIIRQLLERSDRVTLMTNYELHYADGRLRALAFEPAGQAPSMGIAVRANWLPTKLHSDFMELVRQQVRIGLPRPQLRAVG